MLSLRTNKCDTQSLRACAERSARLWGKTAFNPLPWYWGLLKLDRCTWILCKDVMIVSKTGTLNILSSPFNFLLLLRVVAVAFWDFLVCLFFVYFDVINGM